MARRVQEKYAPLMESTLRTMTKQAKLFEVVGLDAFMVCMLYARFGFMSAYNLSAVCTIETRHDTYASGGFAMLLAHSP